MKKIYFLTFILLLGILNYKVSAQSWEQFQKICAFDRQANDQFGGSIAIYGNYAIIGSIREDEDANGENTISEAGSAYIFEFDGTNWQLAKKLTPLDRAADDLFGLSVDIDSNYAVVSSYLDDEDENGENTLNEAGSVYIFKNNSGNWEQIQKIVSSDRDQGDGFGRSVSIYGDYIIISADNENEDEMGINTLDNAGSAYIFKNNSGIWEQIQKITPVNRAPMDHFGGSVALFGDFAVIGAKYEAEDENDNNSIDQAGSAYIYKNNSGIWELIQKIVSSDRAAVDCFGRSVDICDDYIIVGAARDDEDSFGNNTLNYSGSAYIFKRSNNNWNEIKKITASDRSVGDMFGWRVAICNDIAVVGANFDSEDENNINTLTNAGSAYIFKNNSDNWTQEQKIVAEDRNEGASFGGYVAIDGENIFIASHGDGFDEDGMNLLESSGSAYFFKYDETVNNTNHGIFINIKVYPNPTAGLIKVEGIKRGYALVTNILGKTILQKQISNNINTLDISNEPKGLYFVTLNFENNTLNFKILLQ